MAGRATLFALQGISKNYGKITALDGLSVEMPEGSIALLGPNGAGKTTMIRTLLGLISIDSGTGQVLGMDIRTGRLGIRQAVGLMPEDQCLFPGMDGIEFVAYAGELVGMPASAAMQRAHEVLDYIGLGETRYRRVESYSTGMKQRTKLAAALIHDPRLLILDEPTNGMDPSGRDEIIELARDLCRNKGMHLIFSSHLLPDVEAVCEHVMVLGRGKLLAHGRIQELKQKHDRMVEVRVKHDQERFASRLAEAGCNVESKGELLLVQLSDGQNPADLWKLAADSSNQIRHLRPSRSSLEEVFLRAVQGNADANL